MAGGEPLYSKKGKRTGPFKMDSFIENSLALQVPAGTFAEQS